MRRNRQLRNLATYLAFSAATSAIGFSTVVVLTRLLVPTEYGLIGVFLSLLFFVAPLISLGADGLIAVNKTVLDASHYETFQRTYIGLAYATFGVLQALFLLAWVFGLYHDPLFAAAPMLGLVRFLASMAATEYVADQRPFAFGAMTVLTAAFSLALTVALIRLFDSWGGWRILAMVAADLVMLAVRYHGRLRLLVSGRWDRSFTKQILRFGLPGLLVISGGWALNESDKVVVARISGMESAGIYAAAAALATIMLTFNQSLTNALYPDMFRRLESGTGGTWPILLRYTAGFVGMSSVFSLLVISAYFLFAGTILPPRYTGGQSVFIALVLSGIAVSFYRPFGLAAEYFKLARIRAVAILAGGALTIAVATFGVRHGGILWAPVGIAAGYVLSGLLLAGGLDWHRRRG